MYRTWDVWVLEVLLSVSAHNWINIELLELYKINLSLFLLFIQMSYVRHLSLRTQFHLVIQYLSVYTFVYLSVFLLYICLWIHLPNHVLTLSVCPSTHPVRPSVCCQSTYLTDTYLFTDMFVYSSICLFLTFMCVQVFQKDVYKLQYIILTFCIYIFCDILYLYLLFVNSKPIRYFFNTKILCFFDLDFC